MMKSKKNALFTLAMALSLAASLTCCVESCNYRFVRRDGRLLMLRGRRVIASLLDKSPRVRWFRGPCRSLHRVEDTGSIQPRKNQQRRAPKEEPHRDVVDSRCDLPINQFEDNNQITAKYRLDDEQQPEHAQQLPLAGNNPSPDELEDNEQLDDDSDSELAQLDTPQNPGPLRRFARFMAGLFCCGSRRKR